MLQYSSLKWILSFNISIPLYLLGGFQLTRVFIIFSLQESLALKRLHNSPSLSSWVSSPLTAPTQPGPHLLQTFHDGVPVIPVTHHGHEEKGDEHRNAAD